MPSRTKASKCGKVLAKRRWSKAKKRGSAKKVSMAKIDADVRKAVRASNVAKNAAHQVRRSARLASKRR